MTGQRADAQEIASGIKALFRPLDVIELRVPRTSGTNSGYYNDVDKLTREICTQNGANVYYTLNPCDPKLLARAHNRIRERAKVTTSDKDITRRCWLLVDVDPERPADISASDEEHAAALQRVRDIRWKLTEEGWPAPIVADSGNGGHLDYAIDLPNDDDSKKLVEAALKALAARFNTATVKVDVTVFNAARIIKAYGSVARKGDSTPDRPHRLSRLLEVPPKLEIVSREQLAALAASVQPPVEKKSSLRQADSQGSFNVEAWINEHGLAVRPPVAYDGGRKWVLVECPFNPEHKAPDAAIFEAADGKLGFRCLHSSCADYQWRALRERIEGPRKKRRKRKPSVARVDLSALPVTVDTLSALSVFAGLIQFQSVRRRGPMIILKTTEDREIIFPTTAELGTFGKARAVIADGANVYLPTPPQGQVRSDWDAAAGLMLRLAAADVISVEPALKEEVRDLLKLMWRAGGQPHAKDNFEFMSFMHTILVSKRDPRSDAATPPVVFTAEEACWVHAPTLRAWLSTPQFTNKHYPLADVRNGLLLLGFDYCENLTRRSESDSETLCLWRGQIDVLE